MSSSLHPNEVKRVLEHHEKQYIQFHQVEWWINIEDNENIKWNSIKECNDVLLKFIKQNWVSYETPELRLMLTSFSSQITEKPDSNRREISERIVKDYREYVLKCKQDEITAGKELIHQKLSSIVNTDESLHVHIDNCRSKEMLKILYEEFKDHYIKTKSGSKSGSNCGIYTLFFDKEPLTTQLTEFEQEMKDKKLQPYK